MYFLRFLCRRIHFFGRTLRLARLSRGCMLSVVFGFISTATYPCLGQDFPVDLNHLRERAEEHYFDGEYEDAKRVLAEAEKWLDSPLNRRDLIKLDFDHSVVDAIFSGFRAEVFIAMGERAKAENALRHAEKTLKNRRSRYAAVGRLPPRMLQYEAFIEFVRGDLLQPVPDFGLARNPTIPDEVRQLFLASKAANSLAAYRRAEIVLGNPLANDDSDFFRRLEGRLLTNLARGKILKVGSPTKSDVVDCAALLNRAEVAFQKGSFWQQVIHQANFERLPLTFKAVDQQTQDPTRRLGLKRQFAQTISDWAEIELLRAELSAYQEQDATARPEAIETAERGYDEVVGFMKSQFGGEHASAQRIQLSRARWILALASAPDVNPETRLSYLQDCLSDLGKIKNLPSGAMIQVQALELAASSMMLAADSGVGQLPPAEMAKLNARMEELKQILAERLRQ
jgi:hypothetical protein